VPDAPTEESAGLVQGPAGYGEFVAGSPAVSEKNRLDCARQRVQLFHPHALHRCNGYPSAQPGSAAHFDEQPLP
jgi:hypothetical protein